VVSASSITPPMATQLMLVRGSKRANKRLGTRICVSATLAEAVKNFRGRPIGDLLLRGRAEALRAFEPLTAEQFNDPATKSYLEAFAKLEAGDPGAIAAFAAHL
jgi:adenylate cyclase